MRERARDRGRLEDIVTYANNVATIIDGITFEELTADIRIYYSVIKNIEIVGEAAFMLTRAFKEAHSETPWKLVQGMRHILVHDYTRVIPRILWGTATENIPELRQQAELYIAETDWDEWEQGEDTFRETDDAIAKAALKMKNDNMPIDLISKYTGLSLEEIENIE